MEHTKGHLVELKTTKPAEDRTHPIESVVTQQNQRPPIPEKPKVLSDRILQMRKVR